jgi:hypothetical protein
MSDEWSLKMGKGYDENAPKITDRSSGKYFYVYAGFLRGKRISRLSIGAEAWFWRACAACDDFGNGDAEPALFFALTAGLRMNVTMEQANAYLLEMIDHKLVKTYKSCGLCYYHVVDYQILTPAPGGNYVHKYPPSKWDMEDLEMLRQERERRTGRKRKDSPGSVSSSTHSLTPPQTQTQTLTQTPPQTQARNADPEPERSEEEALARLMLRMERGWSEEEITLSLAIAKNFPEGALEAVLIAVGSTNKKQPKNRKAYLQKLLENPAELRLIPGARKAAPPVHPSAQQFLDAEERKINARLEILPTSELERLRAEVIANWSQPNKSESLIRLAIYQRLQPRPPPAGLKLAQ